MWFLGLLACNFYQPEDVDFTPPSQCQSLSAWAEKIGVVGQSRGEVGCNGSPLGIPIDRGSLHRLLHGGAVHVRVEGCEESGFESISLPAVTAEYAWNLARLCLPGWSDTAFPGKAATLTHDGTIVKVTSSPRHWQWAISGREADSSNTVIIDTTFPDTVVALESSGGSPF